MTPLTEAQEKARKAPEEILVSKEDPTINSKVVLIGKTDKGKVYIKQVAKNSFELRTGKRFLGTVASLKAAEEFLKTNGFKLKRVKNSVIPADGKIQTAKPVDPALAELAKATRDVLDTKL